VTTELAVLGVPSSAGAHHAGQDLAPAALRSGAFLERLRGHGLSVTDRGDVAGERWSPDVAGSTARNVDAVVRVALALADAVEAEATTADAVPVVLGGDCTITLGVVAGLQRVHDDVRLVYFDGDADLSSPERTRSGILDATGVAHLLGVADTELGRIGRQVPMLGDHQLTLLGYDPTDHDSYDADVLAEHPGLVHASDADVRADPHGAAQRALAAVQGGQAVVVHFDVDAVDSGDLALGNFPHYGTGVPLSVAAQVLQALLGAPNLAAVVLTEINPTHDPSGGLLERYIDAVAGAFAHALGA
jgi:arginase